MDPLSQQLLLTSGGKQDPTYVDDVFSTYLYTGTGSARSINNAIDVSGEGAMVWIKSRNLALSHQIFDTVRGATQVIASDNNYADWASTTTLTAFNNNGFSLGTNSAVNSSGDTYSSWSFRKAPGFCDIVKFVGDGSSSRTISHNLGCKPGLILFKNLDTNIFWAVWHKDLKYVDTSGSDDQHAKGNYLRLDEAVAVDRSADIWPAEPTAANFTVGYYWAVNENTKNIVAYVFAGGESAAATARSVDFDAAGDYLTTDQSNDFAMGTGDFTVEGWFKYNDQGQTNFGYFMNNSSGLSSTYGVHVNYTTSNGLAFYTSGSSQNTNYHPPKGQWFHLALVRHSGTTSLYVNGTLIRAGSDTTNYGGERFVIGGYHSASFLFSGWISNFRVVKGTAVYTSSFRPPTAPLTSTSGTSLLCCNNSSVTGATTGTVTSSGNPTASTDSPFDDPEGFKFGEEGDQNIIKTGSYVGNANDVGPEVFLGFEPQWLMVKNSNAAESWHIMDCMRGIVTRTGASNSGNGNENKLYADWSGAETDSNESISLTATGFKVVNSNSDMNGNGNTMIYIAIRRSDGYCGKLPSLGTDVFAMDVGSNNFPAFDSTFPVDFVLQKAPDAAANWLVPSRLTGSANYLKTNLNSAQASWAVFDFDSNVGWGKASTWASATNNAWMWKRHAGMDVVTYTGNGATQAQGGQTIKHNLSKTPEMIWLKYRNDTYDWQVYHKGLNGGTNPQNYKVQLNDTSAESGNAAWWNNTAPTSTAFTVGDSTRVNYDGGNYIAMLFASANDADGNPISKVGSYTGNASSSGPTITLGFAPRFIIIKCASVGGTNWFVYDTLRGLTAGNDQRLLLNDNSNQVAADDVDPSATGFQVVSTWDQLNGNNAKYIYYAHA